MVVAGAVENLFLARFSGAAPAEPASKNISSSMSHHSPHDFHKRATAARGVLPLEVLGVVAAGRFDPAVLPAAASPAPTPLDEAPSRGARCGGASCLRSLQAAQTGGEFKI